MCPHTYSSPSSQDKRCIPFSASIPSFSLSFHINKNKYVLFPVFFFLSSSLSLSCQVIMKKCAPTLHPALVSLHRYLTALSVCISDTHTREGGVMTTWLLCSGRRDEVDVDAVGWARHLAGAEQVGVFHLVMEGGRCATAIPYSTPASSSSCAIL